MVKDTKSFKIEANKIHNGFYLYDKSKYKYSREKVIITCPTHGDFKQKPNNHLFGKGCPKCALNKKRTSDNRFKIQMDSKFGENFDFSSSEYINSRTPIDIKCNICENIITIKPKHISNLRCKKCDKSKIFQSFLIRANEIHGNKYDYSLVVYEKNNKKVSIICPHHGEFEQRPDNHLEGKGCLKCNESKGERKIEKILIQNKIKYIKQKTFDDCISIKKRKFKYDFYLPDLNLLIEYNGKQHYTPIDFFGGKKAFNKRVKYDTIKEEYCTKNKIDLLVIKYNEQNLMEKKILSYV